MAIFKPFKIIGQIFPAFILFFLANIVIGQIGILASIALGAKETDLSFQDLLNANLNAGNLYTFSIAIIAASFTQYFVDFLIEEELLFKKYKILLGVISFFIIVFMTIFYSAHQIHSLQDLDVKSPDTVNTITQNTDSTFSTHKQLAKQTPTNQANAVKKPESDTLQIIFYIISIVISTYMFCVNFLKLDPDSYIEFDDQNMLRLKRKSSKQSTDSQGARV